MEVYHPLSLLYFPLLHIPPLLSTPDFTTAVFTTPAFSNPAFSAPPSYYVCVRVKQVTIGTTYMQPHRRDHITLSRAQQQEQECMFIF